MKHLSKIIAMTILASFAGSQIAMAQTATTQDYKIVPPYSEQNNFQSLPSVPNNSELYAQPNNTRALQGSVTIVPVGSTFDVTTNTAINSATSQVGDLFAVTLTKPLFVNGKVVVPEGSEAVGQVTYIENAGMVGKNGQMDIRFTSVRLPNGEKVPIVGKIMTKDKTGMLKGGTISTQLVHAGAAEVVTTAGGALAGLSIGAIAGGAGVGTVVGTAAGGILGIGYILARKGKEVVIPSGSKLSVVLDQPVTVGR